MFTRRVRPLRLPEPRVAASVATSTNSHLEIDAVTKNFGPQAVLKGVNLSVAKGGTTAIVGPVRLRQDHAAAPDRRLRASRHRQHLAERQQGGGRRRLGPGAQAPRRLRGPGRRPVPAPDRRAEHLLRPGRRASSRRAPRRQGAGRRTAGNGLPGPGHGQAPPAPALRRPAAAGRPGPGAGPQACAHAAGRAVLRPGRRPAGGHPPRRRPRS